MWVRDVREAVELLDTETGQRVPKDKVPLARPALWDPRLIFKASCMAVQSACYSTPCLIHIRECSVHAFQLSGLV